MGHQSTEIRGERKDKSNGSDIAMRWGVATMTENVFPWRA